MPTRIGKSKYPDRAAALKLVAQGDRFLKQGDAPMAERNWLSATRMDPQCVPAWNHLTDFLILNKRLQEANDCLATLISLAERTPENLLALAQKSWLLQRYDQCRIFLADALLLSPSPTARLKACLLRAKLNFLDDEWDVAVQNVNQVLEADPSNLVALKIRQQCWQALAYPPEDVADSRLLNQIWPDAHDHASVIFNSLFLSETTPEIIFEEAVIWNNLYAAPLAVKILSHANLPDPHRRLKIGYVSPDFKDHAIMKLLPTVFEHADQTQFEVFAYSLDTQPDSLTHYARGAVRNFIELPSDPDAIAARVRADGVDILVDLAGHTMPGTALLAFAQKPAPVQVNWMGVHATTGLTAMDYFLGDAHMPCPGTEHLFTEKVYRLPHSQYCYRSLADPGIAPPPALAQGHITFGCFNNPKKFSRQVVKLWSMILHSHPQSRLLFKYKGLSRELKQRRLRQWFTEDGITPDRLLFEEAVPLLEYLTSFNRVDIALDPFPYNGGTTTLDTLWMGVPVVSLQGRLAVSCCGASFLSAVGLPVARTPEQYVALAAQFVAAVHSTPNLRQDIRAAMLRSPLMDEPGLARALAGAYREMWQTWCSLATKPASASSPGNRVAVDP